MGTYENEKESVFNIRGIKEVSRKICKILGRRKRVGKAINFVWSCSEDRKLKGKMEK